MIRIAYNEALGMMEKGLKKQLSDADARRMAQIFAGNSADGVYSHGMNRYVRYIRDMESGLCDSKVTEAERVSGFGSIERWDAHFGVGPLIAEQATRRAMDLASLHGVGCVALANNSHWLRAGRYALMMADAGYAGLCLTNTCMNLSCWGAKTHSTGNNPVAVAVPGKDGSLLLDMAVSQYAYGKLEIMAQEGKKLDAPYGYDSNGELTNDPAEICKTGLQLPMAMWKGTALSIMLDLLAVTLSNGRTSLEIGKPSDGEKGMSQVYICMNAAVLGDTEEVTRKLEETRAFLHSVGDVHVPGENLKVIREKNMREGIPVTEETWAAICREAEEA